MDLVCFKCPQRFSDISVAFKHLKKVHLIQNHADGIFCLVPKCVKTCRTFDSLRSHIKKCVTQAKPESLDGPNHIVEYLNHEVNKLNLRFL